MRIATLDDDADQLELTRYTLKAIGHDCHTFVRSVDFRRALARETFDLVIVDWNLPDTTGPEIVRWVRAKVSTKIPILFLTSRNDEKSIVEGLASGADDFMTKPMRTGELIARVRAILRRVYDSDEPKRLTWGRYRFEPASSTVFIGEEAVVLKQKEFDLALMLFRHQGRLVSRVHLLESVWTASNATGVNVASRSLDTHISRVRKLLRLTPEQGYRLNSAYGQGYRLEEVPEQVA